MSVFKFVPCDMCVNAPEKMCHGCRCNRETIERLLARGSVPLDGLGVDERHYTRTLLHAQLHAAEARERHAHSHGDTRYRDTEAVLVRGILEAMGER